MSLDNESANIKSYQISDMDVLLDINHSSDDYLGRMSIVSSSVYNDLIWGTDTSEVALEANSIIHFVYGTNSQSLNLSIDVIAYGSPIPPNDLTAITLQDRVILNWSPSTGPGDSLYYVIFRNLDSIYTTVENDTHYVDNQGIEGSMPYSYYITCRNNIGESQPSNTISIESWPSEEDVDQNQILAIYPNPVRKRGDSNILYALETNYYSTSLELINIRGQIVKTASLLSYKQGWHRESINNLISPKVAAGIYIIRLRPGNELGRSQKITILP